MGNGSVNNELVCLEKGSEQKKRTVYSKIWFTTENILIALFVLLLK